MHACRSKTKQGARCSRHTADPSGMCWQHTGRAAFFGVTVFVQVVHTNTTCTICTENLLDPLGGNQSVRLSCGHVFHFSCVEQWFESSHGRKCPCCNSMCTSTYTTLKAEDFKEEDKENIEAPPNGTSTTVPHRRRVNGSTQRDEVSSESDDESSQSGNESKHEALNGSGDESENEANSESEEEEDKAELIEEKKDGQQTHLGTPEAVELTFVRSKKLMITRQFGWEGDNNTGDLAGLHRCVGIHCRFNRILVTDQHGLSMFTMFGERVKRLKLTRPGGVRYSAAGKMWMASPVRGYVYTIQNGVLDAFARQLGALDVDVREHPNKRRMVAVLSRTFLVVYNFNGQEVGVMQGIKGGFAVKFMDNGLIAVTDNLGDKILLWDLSRQRLERAVHVTRPEGLEVVGDKLVVCSPATQTLTCIDVSADEEEVVWVVDTGPNSSPAGIANSEGGRMLLADHALSCVREILVG